MDFREVNTYLISKALVLIIVSIFCRLPFWAILLMAAGIILVCIAAVALGDLEYKSTLREILYYSGFALQLIPLLIVTFGYLDLPDDKIGFIRAVALGWLSISLCVSWFADGYDGTLGYLSSYGAAGIILLCEVLVWAICGISVDSQYRILTIVNLVVCAISVIIILIARLKKGSNME